MSLGKNIYNLRKKKGLSQEALSEKVKVTRQTISNWELDETSPNPEQLKLLSEALNISIDSLLDNDVTTKEKNLGKSHNYKIYFVIGIIIFLIILFIISFYLDEKKLINGIEESIYCKLYEEEHGLSIEYDELTRQIIKIKGDSYFNDILDLDKYDDAKQIFNIINDYVKKNGGICQTIKERDLSDIVDIEIKELTNTNMVIVIHDTNPYTIVYGEDFYIEKYVGSLWESLKMTDEHYSFNAMAYHVDENGLLEMKQDWAHIYGKLPKGMYRIVKNVFFSSDTPIDNNDIFYIWREFEIE